jgi:hypothetical protein
MIELEIQALAVSREGLLIDIGRCVVASGYTLQRQRLTQDDHGVLMTMVVRGPSRKQRALEDALEAHERIVSFDVSPFVEGAPKPHFAASPPAPVIRQPVAQVPKPAVAAAPVAPVVAPAPVAAPAPVVEKPKAPELAAAPAINAVPERRPEPEPEFEFFIAPKPKPAPAPAPVVLEPFVEVIPLGPDIEAVEKVVPKLTNSYPQIFPRLMTLDSTVVDAARESSLMLAGQRTGAWVFERDYAASTKLSLREAIERIAIPALRALVDVESKGEQVHIHQSPLCTKDGHSGCKFFAGYLEGLLSPAIASKELSIFAVCCRSWGAGECILAISD